MLSNSYKKFTEINIVFSFSLTLVGALLAPYFETLGFFDWQISLMFTVFPLVNILFLPFFGRLADRFNRRVIIWLGIWLEILALLLYILGTHWILIVAGRFLDALAASLVALIVLTKIEDSVSDNSRGRATGNSLSLAYIGELVGPLVGAFLADYFFIRLPFLASIVILIVLSFFLISGRFADIKYLKIGLSEISWWSEIKLFFKYRQLKGMGIMGMVMHATNPAMKVFLPILIIDQLGMSYKSIGIAIFFYGIMHIAQGRFGRWGDKFGHWRLVIAGTFIAALSFIAIFYINYYWLLVLVLFIMGIGTSLWNISAWSLMSHIGEQEKIEAQVLTSYFSVAKMGSLISFLLSAWLIGLLGLKSIFLINGLMIIIGILLAYRYLRPRSLIIK